MLTFANWETRNNTKYTLSTKSFQYPLRINHLMKKIMEAQTTTSYSQMMMVLAVWELQIIVLKGQVYQNNSISVNVCK